MPSWRMRGVGRVREAGVSRRLAMPRSGWAGTRAATFLRSMAPADVVEIEEHGLDEEGQVRAAPLGAPVAAEPPAPLALAAPLRLRRLALPPKALRAGRFGTRRVVAGRARRPPGPPGKVLRPIRGRAPEGDCARRRLHLHAGRHFVVRARSARGRPRGQDVGRGEGAAGMVDGEERRAVARGLMLSSETLRG